MTVVACVKWVDLRPEIDPLTGAVHTSDRTAGWSAADAAAVETALRIGDAWNRPVAVCCVGPASARRGLEELLAAGVRTAVLIEAPATAPSDSVAAALVEQIGGLGEVAAVVCGDYSADRGSGSVPAFVSHGLGAAQALGLVAVDPAEDRRVLVTRRLGGGRSERLELSAPMVLSVEGSVASLRRGSLSGALAARRDDAVVTVTGASFPQPTPVMTRPMRPRARALPAPAAADARTRIVSITGALVDRTPPRTITVGPDEAADAILEALAAWGYR